MLCVKCHTINPDHCRSCLECQAALMPASINKVKTYQSAVIVGDALVFQTPKFFTRSWKIKQNIIAGIPTMIILLLSAFEVTALIYELLPIELLLLIKLSIITIYLVYIFGFYPLMNGDPAIERFFSNYQADAIDQFIVQVTCSPRQIGGLEGFLEDADDVGILRLQSQRGYFQGDSTSFMLTQNDIAAMEFKRKGVRGQRICGPAITIRLKRQFGAVTSLTIHPRMGATTRQSRQFNRDFGAAIKKSFPQYFPDIR